ncbi:MAG: superoxide dismutase [Breznakia sp.]
MSYILKDLPYAYSALEPYIDEQTMRIHHDKHHQGYVNNLNAIVEKHPSFFEGKEIEEVLKNIDTLPEDIRSIVKNNGGGHANHTLFWEGLSEEKQAVEGEVIDAIIKTFTSFEAFKEAFAKAATTRFGSGWAWLVLQGDTLEIVSTANQDSPLSDGKIPLLALDVWEHAYYLKYQNLRGDYITAFWNIVNWQEVNRRYLQYKK